MTVKIEIADRDGVTIRFSERNTFLEQMNYRYDAAEKQNTLFIMVREGSREELWKNTQEYVRDLERKEQEEYERNRQKANKQVRAIKKAPEHSDLSYIVERLGTDRKVDVNIDNYGYLMQIFDMLVGVGAINKSDVRRSWQAIVAYNIEGIYKARCNLDKQEQSIRRIADKAAPKYQRDGIRGGLRKGLEKAAETQVRQKQNGNGDDRKWRTAEAARGKTGGRQKG